MRKPLLFLVILAFLLSGCAIAMNRRFDAERGFVPAVNGWAIGVPEASALKNIFDKEAWNSQSFRIRIPMTHPDHYVAGFIRDRRILIDSIRVILLATQDTLYTEMAVRPPDHLLAGRPWIDFWQNYLEGETIPTFVTDTITIPPSEDSIRIEFTVKIPRSEDHPGSAKALSFDLVRQEGKKLFFDLGR